MKEIIRKLSDKWLFQAFAGYKLNWFQRFIVKKVTGWNLKLKK